MKIYNADLQKESTSNATIAEINATGNTSVATKEYADLTSASGNLQIEITTAAYTIQDIHNKYTVFFNRATAITVNLDTLSIANFECSFYNLGVGDVTFINGTATLGVPDGNILETDKVAALIRKLATTTYKLKGELTV